MVVRLPARLLTYLLLALIAAASLFPMVFTFTGSLMGADEIARHYGSLSSGEAGTSPLHLVPDMITLAGYAELLFLRPHYLVKFWVSMLLCCSITAGQTVVACLGGYAFSRFRFPGRDAIFFVLLVIMMMPYQVTLVPNYITLDRMGLIGGYPAVILPGVFSAFGVFLMRQVMASVPGAMLEAARIDGAGSWRALWRILLPNCRAGLASLVILSFADSWNMVEQPIVFLKDSNKYPLSVFLVRLGSVQPALGFACGLLSILPVLLLFLFLEEELVSGISHSLLK